MGDWLVHKFGGASVAGAERYRAVADIVRGRPADWGGRAAGGEEFLGGLGQHDGAIDALPEAARGRGQVLRFVGSIEPGGGVSAGLRAFPLGHPFAGLTGSENVVSFRTARYNVQPMIVRGPGAGPDVTAAGVIADLLRLATFLGAPL